MSEKPDVPSAAEMAHQLLCLHSEEEVASVIKADRERIRAETLAPFYDLVEWDSEENLEGDYAERWIKLGNKLRWMLPPKEAPDA